MWDVGTGRVLLFSCDLSLCGWNYTGVSENFLSKDEWCRDEVLKFFLLYIA